MEKIISVIMPVFNEEEYIYDSVSSVLNQTFKEFELIIIDDASSDNTINIIKEFKDIRIKVIRNSSNIGITKSLNKGISIAKGKYIARMDADDVALPNRFTTQCSYLESNDDVGVVGGQAIKFGDVDYKNNYRYKETKFDNIKATFFTNNPLIHSTIMIRKSVLDEHNICYDENMRASQDYEFWIRLSCYTKIVNLPEVLILYRVRKNSITSTSKNYIKTRYDYIFKRLFEILGMDVDEFELDNYVNAILLDSRKIHHNDLKKVFDKIIKNNNAINYTSDYCLKQKLGSIWIKLILKTNRKALLSKWTLFGLIYTVKYMYKNIIYKSIVKIKTSKTIEQESFKSLL